MEIQNFSVGGFQSSASTGRRMGREDRGRTGRRRGRGEEPKEGGEYDEIEEGWGHERREGEMIGGKGREGG
jgi:hypothetical protein